MKLPTECLMNIMFTIKKLFTTCFFSNNNKKKKRKKQNILVKNSMVFSALLIVLSLLLYTHCEIEDGISYVVGPGKRDCFYRVLAVGDIMDFDLQV